MKKLTALLLLLASVVCHAQSLKQADELSRPWTFWYWMYGAVSAEGIRADLQAMKDAGLGGCYLMPIRGVQERPEYNGEAQQLSPRFWQMVDLALQQADSLGLQMGIHICDGFALAGGPWIKPEESMQRVVWSDTIVTVPKGRPQTFPLPNIQGFEGYFADIASFAVHAEAPLPEPEVSGTIQRDDNGTFRSKEAGYIMYSFAQPQTVRSLQVEPSGNNVQSQRLLIEASDDGLVFRPVRQLVPPRQGWQNTDFNYTFSLPTTTARHFRFSWTPEGTEPGSEDLDAAKWAPTLKIKNLRLSSDACIDLYEGKSGAVWRISVDEIEDFDISDSSEKPIPFEPGVTQLPAGRWRILRFAHTATGHTNATAGGARGLECDKFSAEAVNKQIDHWFGEFMKRPHHDVIRYMHVDSWECGSQNWSTHFADEFLRRRGYDLIPYLPVYAGIPMEGAEQVLRDIRLTIDELLHDVFFQTVKSRAERYGVQLSAESVAPTMVADGMTHYKYVDLPMGEFWLNSPTHDKPNDMLDAISAAHVYGKNVVQAEGFTEVRGVWNETPAMIKPLLDRNLALGMNRLFFHVFTHNPWTDRRPGMTLDGIGLFFQRDQTWMPEASALVDYVTRCQYWLQKGTPVADIAVFTGEEMPRRAFTPDRLVPLLPGLFGPERVAAERKRLENRGQPMEESPVGVNHSAGILDLKDWVNPMHGYQYDSMNRDALLQWSDDYPYRTLVIPPVDSLSPEVSRQIDALRSRGIAIIDRPYTQSDLTPLGIEPDVILPPGIAYTHRSRGEFGEIYFLSNQTDREQSFTASFRSGLYSDVVLYHPLTATLSHPAQATVNQPRTDVSVSLAPHGSVFVFLSSAVSYIGLQPFRSFTATPLQTAPWQLSFTDNGLHLQTDSLIDWSRHPDDSIRYYSGHVTYTTTFQHRGKPRGTVRLSLGRVCDVAHVYVNGKDCGIVWTDPYEVDITSALRRGKNTLKVVVVNTWANALLGAEQGKSPFGGIWTNARYRMKEQTLLPAGLLGPLQLKTSIEQK